MLKRVTVTDSASEPLSVTVQFDLTDRDMAGRGEKVGIEHGDTFLVLTFAPEPHKPTPAPVDDTTEGLDLPAPVDEIDDPAHRWHTHLVTSNDPRLRETTATAVVTRTTGSHASAVLTINGHTLATLGLTDNLTAFAHRDGRRIQSLPVTIDHI